LLLLLLATCEDCVEHERNYKELDDRNNQVLDEHLQQDKRIIDLGYQIELLKDEMAYGPMGGSVAGFGDDLTAEDPPYQQATQRHSS
jgi:hypothetical protein